MVVAVVVVVGGGARLITGFSLRFTEFLFRFLKVLLGFTCWFFF